MATQYHLRTTRQVHLVNVLTGCSARRNAYARTEITGVSVESLEFIHVDDNELLQNLIAGNRILLRQSPVQLLLF